MLLKYIQKNQIFLFSLASLTLCDISMTKMNNTWIYAVVMGLQMFAVIAKITINYMQSYTPSWFASNLLYHLRSWTGQFSSQCYDNTMWDFTPTTFTWWDLTDSFRPFSPQCMYRKIRTIDRNRYTPTWFV